MKHQLRWFINRIGKKVYRQITTCRCKDCIDVVENGLIITDEDHARYLHLIQYDLDIDYN